MLSLKQIKKSGESDYDKLISSGYELDIIMMDDEDYLHRLNEPKLEVGASVIIVTISEEIEGFIERTEDTIERETDTQWICSDERKFYKVNRQGMGLTKESKIYSIESNNEKEIEQDLLNFKGQYYAKLLNSQGRWNYPPSLVDKLSALCDEIPSD